MRNRLIIFFVLASVLPVITVILVFEYGVNQIFIDRNTQYSISLSQNKIQNIDELLGNTESALLEISTNPTTQYYLQQVNSSNFRDEDMYRLTSETGQELDTFLRLYQVIDGIYLIPNGNSIPIYRGALNLEYFENYSKNSIYQASIASPQRILWTLSPEQMVNKFKLTLSKGIINNYKNETLGVLVIDLKVDNLFTNGPTFGFPNDEFLCVVDKQGQLIYDNGPSSHTNEVIDQIKTISAESLSGKSEIIVGSSTFIVTYATSSINGWRLFFAIPRDRILQGIDSVTRITWLIAGLFLLFSLFAAFFLYFTFYSPIQKLMAAMKRIEDGNLDLEVKIQRKDELGKLASAYNFLVQQIRTMISDIRAHEKKKTELEIKALQAQIMPHFLYNTLNCVISLARMRKTAVIVDMVEALIDLLRMSANNNQSIISISEEIHYVKSYIRIMSYRYDVPVDVSYEIDKDVLPLGIMKFSIQPVVENSYIHAFHKGIQDCKISIRIYQDNNWVHVLVNDNGEGMDDDRLAKVSEKLGQSISSKDRLTGIGIENIHQRLLMEYGAPSGLSISSRPGKGTAVHITFPTICLPTDTK